MTSLTDMLFWWTGALVWVAAVGYAGLGVVLLLWRVVFATVDVVFQLWGHFIIRGRTRAEMRCTVGEAWFSAIRCGPRYRRWVWK